MKEKNGDECESPSERTILDVLGMCSVSKVYMRGYDSSYRLNEDASVSVPNLLV